MKCPTGSELLQKWLWNKPFVEWMLLLCTVIMVCTLSLRFGYMSLFFSLLNLPNMIGRQLSKISVHISDAINSGCVYIHCQIYCRFYRIYEYLEIFRISLTVKNRGISHCQLICHWDFKRRNLNSIYCQFSYIVTFVI